MFNRKNQNEKSGLEKAIDEIFSEMAVEEGHTERYDQLTKQLDRLMKLREQDARRFPVSPDTLVVAGANLLGIGLIVGYEQKHVVTSAAKNFIMKLR